jgi:hypothetical protein
VARTTWHEVGAVEGKSCDGADGVDEKRMTCILQKKDNDRHEDNSIKGREISGPILVNHEEE